MTFDLDKVRAQVIPEVFLLSPILARYSNVEVLASADQLVSAGERSVCSHQLRHCGCSMSDTSYETLKLDFVAKVFLKTEKPLHSPA